MAPGTSMPDESPGCSIEARKTCARTNPQRAVAVFKDTRYPMSAAVLSLARVVSEPGKTFSLLVETVQATKRADPENAASIFQKRGNNRLTQFLRIRRVRQIPHKPLRLRIEAFQSCTECRSPNNSRMVYKNLRKAVDGLCIRFGHWSSVEHQIVAIIPDKFLRAGHPYETVWGLCDGRDTTQWTFFVHNVLDSESEPWNRIW
jgi:hypothetical protein